ncbi:MAG: hypothetical protein NUW24_16530, partial [Anaerolineae bacterium]|jgi:predicted DNA binding CopG/RHH family protein|nr:hypothetical protein [Anaerolineae bacterium]
VREGLGEVKKPEFNIVELVSIALPPEDINAIREKAAATRMSCQTFIANLVHQYWAGNLVEKPRDA